MLPFIKVNLVNKKEVSQIAHFFITYSLLAASISISIFISGKPNAEI